MVYHNLGAPVMPGTKLRQNTGTNYMNLLRLNTTTYGCPVGGQARLADIRVNTL